MATPPHPTAPLLRSENRFPVTSGLTLRLGARKRRSWEPQEKLWVFLPAATTRRSHLAGLEVSRRAHLGSGGVRRRTGPGERLNSAFPSSLYPRTPLGPNLPLFPPPAYRPKDGRVTLRLAPIRRDLRALVPPHPTADCQPNKREPHHDSSNPLEKEPMAGKD